MTITPSDLTPQPSEQSLVRFQTRAPEVLSSVRALTVTDDDSYRTICEYKLTAADMLKTLTAITDQIKRTHRTALESALIPWERIMAPIEEAKLLAEQKRKDYARAQEQKQQAQMAELMAQRRQEAEKQQRINAAMLEAAGHDAAAEAVRQTPVQVAPVTPAPYVPKVKGIRDAKTWKVRITDKKLFLRAVGARLLLDSEIPMTSPTRDMLRIEAQHIPTDAYFCLFDLDGEVANMHWLRDRARQQKDAFAIPGVQAWQE